MNSINQVTIVDSVGPRRFEFKSDQRRGGQACSYIMTIRKAKNLANGGYSAAGAKSSDMNSIVWISGDEVRVR